MPPTQTFADLDSLGRALAGCLLWHALAEQAQLARKKFPIDGALIGWRTWVYLRVRAHVERLPLRNRVQPRNVIVRVSDLVHGPGHRSPDQQCGYLLEAWPMTSRNLRFGEGFERTRARVVLGHWTGDVPEAQRELLLTHARQSC